MAKAVIHTAEEIIRIRRAAQATAQARDKIAAAIEPGMSTARLDDIAAACIAETGGTSAFLGYCGFPGNICISLNEVVVHGIGSREQIIKDGDIVSIDVGVCIDGAVGDSARTVAVGEVSKDVKRLLSGTLESLDAGIAACRAGNRVSHISAAVEKVANRHRLGVVRDYVGHGCGIKLHEPPEVPNFSGWGAGAKLEPGMVLAIEPMLNLGTWKVITDRSDHWTVRTGDGLYSAHFEHMVLITENQPEILTWPKMM
ncbi:MAG: type I methionyl aminopeptidase [Lentisphaeria bacterium]|nr:type I methionyl aminopeptidase [Lentisphaeria bacterium]